MKRTLQLTTGIATVILAMALPGAAFAQDAPASNGTATTTDAAKTATADAKANPKDDSQVGEIVITGSRNPMKVLETSYGVSVLNQEAISKTNPVGLTDLASSVPGLQGEYANGEANSNLNVRGTEAGFISFISLQEDGLPTQYSPFFSEYEIRNDLSYGRVEAVLGGPSGIFTAQGAAATLNFQSRLPTKSEGEVKASIADFGEYRVDAFVGGPLDSKGLYAAVGGYFRQSNGSRNLGFMGNNGGQIRANIRKVWPNARLSFAVKHIDDRTDYVNPLPVDVSGTYPKALPGFNARDDSLVGPDLRFIDALSSNGRQRRDLATGQQAKITQFTLSGEYDLSDRVTVSNKMRYAKTKTSSLDVRGFANSSLENGATFLAAQLATLRAVYPTTASVRLVRASDGSVVANPATMNGNGLITSADTIDYFRDNSHFIDQFELNYKGERVKLTGGVQFWKINANSGMVSDRILHDIRNHASRMDVQALDASGRIVGHLTDNGVLTYSDVNNWGGLDTTSINPYANAEINVTSNFRIDAGIRYEHSTIKSWAEDVSFNAPVPASNYDASTLATRTLSVTPNGNFVHGSTTMESVSWTIGANLKLASDLAIYGRYASAGDMGFNNEFAFFSIPGFGTPANSNMGLTNKETRLNFGEVGIRYLGRVISGSITAFYTLHKNSGIVSVNSNGANIITPVDTKAYGAEFWFDVKPSDIFKVSFSGVVMSSKKTGSGFNSIPTYRLPGTQLRVSPTLTLGSLDINLTGQYYSTRWADQSATRKLPAYLDLSGTIGYEFAHGFKLSVQGRNLLNKLAFTSGNFREGFTQGPSPYGYASAVPGRVFRLVADVNF